MNGTGFQTVCSKLFLTGAYVRMDALSPLQIPKGHATKLSSNACVSHISIIRISHGTHTESSSHSLQHHFKHGMALTPTSPYYIYTTETNWKSHMLCHV